MLNQPKTGSKSTASFSGARKLAQIKAREFNLVGDFRYGYRNREDLTNLTPGVLVAGSQNVLTNVSGRVAARKGYTLDGTASGVNAPILASYDWFTSKGYERNMRAGYLTSAGNDGKLQYRYVDSTGTVTWRDLMTAQTSTNFNFTTFYDTNNLIRIILFVNGLSQITKWSGAITTIASVGTNTLTKSGTSSWAAEGFESTGTRKVTILGVDYTYTGGDTTTTLTGVTPDPALASPAITAGEIAHQTPVTVLNSAMTAFNSAFPNDLIATLSNHIYVGSLTRNQIYMSKVNTFIDFTETTPTRLVGDGKQFILDGSVVSMIVQEDTMYFSSGQDFWYFVQPTLSSDLTSESLIAQRIKTSPKQASKSQALTGKVKDDIVFVSNEVAVNTLGRVESQYLTPQITDISYSIVNDINTYDFTDGSIIFHRNFIYVSIPKSGIIRVYNRTDVSSGTSTPANYYWEAPLTIPISRFSIIGGELYGHSYGSSDTYKLFNGNNDIGNPINAIAQFSYENSSAPYAKKNMNAYYTEGYISPNTKLTLTLKYDFGGFTSITSYPISGSDNKILFQTLLDGSLGKNPIGSQPLGSITDSPDNMAKFRIINTFTRQGFYEYQPVYSSNDIDQQWEILRRGGNTQMSSEMNVEIKE